MSRRLQVIEDEESLWSLEHDWRRLWERAPRATPFQSPAWLLSWWKIFAPGTLRVLAAWREGRLIGLAPFYIDESRRALPIGISLSDYLDVLIDPQNWALAASILNRGIVDALATDVAAWDMAALAPGAEALALAPEADVQLYSSEVCPVLSLPENATGLALAIPSGKLRKLRMARHRAERLGGYEIEACHGPHISEAFSQLVDLHSACWKDRGGGVLADPRVRQFHCKAVQECDRAGVLNLLLCRVGGRVAGIYYGFQHGAQAYAYLGGFDPGQSFASPGTLLIGRAIEQAIEAGASEFHFLRGGESYKYEWGAVDRRNVRRVFRPARVLANA